MGNYLPLPLFPIRAKDNTIYNIESDIKRLMSSDTHIIDDSTFYLSLLSNNDSIYHKTPKNSSEVSSMLSSPIRENNISNIDVKYTDILSSIDNTPVSDKGYVSVSSFSDSEFSDWNTEFDL